MTRNFNRIPNAEKVQHFYSTTTLGEYINFPVQEKRNYYQISVVCSGQAQVEIERESVGSYEAT